MIKFLIVAAGVGAIVGLIKEWEHSTWEQRLMAALGGAFVAVLIFAAICSIAMCDGPSENGYDGAARPN